MNTVGSFSRALIGAMVVAGFMAPAYATDTEAPSVAVKYGDLDISSSAGVEALYRRIHGAAVRVCELPNESDLSTKLRERTCIQSAMAKAVESVNSPGLAALYNARSGTPVPSVAAR